MKSKKQQLGHLITLAGCFSEVTSSFDMAPIHSQTLMNAYTIVKVYGVSASVGWYRYSLTG